MSWGVGPKTTAKLAALGLHPIGDIAAWRNASGSTARIWHAARGSDDRPSVEEADHANCVRCAAGGVAHGSAALIGRAQQLAILLAGGHRRKHGLYRHR